MRRVHHTPDHNDARLHRDIMETDLIHVVIRMHVYEHPAIACDPVVRDFVADARLAAEGDRGFLFVVGVQEFEDLVAGFVSRGEELLLGGRGLVEAADCVGGEDGEG